MRKKYVKPQNRVVELKDKLMQPTISQGPGTDDPAAKQLYLDDSDNSGSSDDIWED